MNTWLPISTAPRDGTFVLGCYDGPWKEEHEQWRAPQTIAFRAYHPNAPGKKQWRSADGKPVACKWWMPLPPLPVDLMPECDDDHHAMMNKSRIAQSLPPEYLESLLRAAKTQP